MFCSSKQYLAKMAALETNVLKGFGCSIRRDIIKQSLPPFSIPKSSNFLKLKLCSRMTLSAALLNNFKYVDEESKEKSMSVKCNAYQSRRSEPIQIGIEFLSQQAAQIDMQKLKIGVYFATWWALNVVFNIYNKKVLNAFPFPWLVSTLALATGSLMMLVSWTFKIVQAPETDLEFWKALFPVK